MGILQLINIVLFWVFFGFLTQHIAKKRGRNSPIWFLIGLVLGLFGVFLAFFFPKKAASSAIKPQLLPRPTKSDAWIKLWYYLDPSHQQQGPIEFPDLIKNWKQKKLSEKSFVWGEGMNDWKRLSEMPELVKEMDAH